MNEDSGPLLDVSDLRRRAEDRLREQLARPGRPLPTPAEVLRLVHELQVHQIELELQNHALLELRDRLEQSLGRYTDLYDFAPVGYFTLTADGTIRELNLAGAALLGRERSRLIGSRFGLFVSTQTRPDFVAFLDRTLMETAREHCEIALDREEMPPCYAHLEGVGVRDGEERLCHLAAVDTTDRKRAEVALRVALEEKEVLLYEVHHRVKNNLAAIVHMLELQREVAAEAPTVSLLVELGDRIRSMALAHEMLYRSKSFSQIDFRGYLRELVARLHESFASQSAIRLEVAAPETWIDLNAAIPCGLIVNELVTNAFKHAFSEPRSRPESGACKILVSMEQSDAGYTLTVADNGVGLPAELDWRSTRTLGLRLVRMLGQHQLRGQIELDGTDGTRFSLRFGAGKNRR